MTAKTTTIRSQTSAARGTARLAAGVGSRLVNLLVPNAPGTWPGKYDCVDRSLLAGPVRDPLCEKLVKNVPLWVSPNVLTVAGSAPLLVAAGIAYLNSPSACTQVVLIPILAAICAIFWDVLDNMDGKHARQTGAFGVLGDWLDHVLDYISLASVLFMGMIAMRMGCTDLGLAIALSTFLSHLGVAFTTWWGRRFTGQILLGEVSATEFNVIAAFGFLFSAAWPAAWLEPAFEVYTIPLKWNQVVLIAVCASFTFSGVFTTIFRVATHPLICSSKMTLSVLAELWPLGLYFASFVTASFQIYQSGTPNPSLSAAILGVVATGWPLGTIQLISSLAGAPPSRSVNLALSLAPMFGALAHIIFPPSGFLVFAQISIFIDIVCVFLITKEVQRHCNVASLWVLQTKDDR
jgi:phosphatidylglycerophosphate synthase